MASRKFSMLLLRLLSQSAPLFSRRVSTLKPSKCSAMLVKLGPSLSLRKSSVSLHLGLSQRKQRTRSNDCLSPMVVQGKQMNTSGKNCILSEPSSHAEVIEKICNDSRTSSQFGYLMYLLYAQPYAHIIAN